MWGQRYDWTVAILQTSKSWFPKRALLILNLAFNEMHTCVYTKGPTAQFCECVTVSGSFYKAPGAHVLNLHTWIFSLFRIAIPDVQYSWESNTGPINI